MRAARGARVRFRGLPDLILVEEVAALCRCSINTVRTWLGTAKLPSCRPGRRRLIRRVDLLQFLTLNARGRSACAVGRPAPRRRQLSLPGTQP